MTVDLSEVAHRPNISAREFWAAVQQQAIERGDVAGYPIPAQESPLRLAPRHPLADTLEGLMLDKLGDTALAAAEPDEDEEFTPINAWDLECHPKTRLPCRVWLYRAKDSPKTRLYCEPQRYPHIESVTRLLQTFDVAISWELEPEERAMAKLRGLVGWSAYRYYATTGAFLETSERSKVTYVFRRLRPTLALRPDPKTGRMRVLAALCMHPLAWYEGTWAGAMVPTDDVIAHLLFMRGDEPRFWRYANQHPAEARESGL